MSLKETVQLKKNFDKKGFDPGASIFKMALWYYVSLFFFRSGIITNSHILVGILKLFGARIGKQVRIKPHIYIKYPWKLEVGDFCWLAEIYIDNPDWVIIGKHVCVSQKSVLITGNHNYSCKTFDLLTAPIILEDGVWIGANSTVCPGTIVKTHAVLCVGSTANRQMEAFTIYKGNPAKPIKKRRISQ